MLAPGSDLVVTRSLRVPAGELRWRFSGSGGPGGQHANTSNTKVVLTWNIAASTAPSDSQRARLLEELGPTVRVTVTDERSQVRNRDLALERLRSRVREALVVPARRHPPSRTKSSIDRRLADKRLRSDRKTERRVGRDLDE